MILTGMADPDETQPGKPRSVPPPSLSIDEAPSSTARPRVELAPHVERAPTPLTATTATEPTPG
jgi:hypothetical protein